MARTKETALSRLVFSHAHSLIEPMRTSARNLQALQKVCHFTVFTGGAQQYLKKKKFPKGKSFYCFAPPIWPPWTHSTGGVGSSTPVCIGQEHGRPPR